MTQQMHSVDTSHIAAQISRDDPGAANVMKHAHYRCTNCRKTDMVRYFPWEALNPFIAVCWNCHKHDTMQLVGEAEIVDYDPHKKTVKETKQG